MCERERERERERRERERESERERSYGDCSTPHAQINSYNMCIHRLYFPRPRKYRGLFSEPTY